MLVMGRSPEEVTHSLALTIQTLTRAGYIINVKKSDLSPTQDLVYIGGRFVTTAGCVFLLEEGRVALTRCVRAFMQMSKMYPAKTGLQLLGLMASTIPMVEGAGLHIRPVPWFVKSLWSASKGFKFLIMMKTI